jgi:hypothetical protein
MSSRRLGPVVQRYRDAYGGGNTIVGIGATIKVIGIVLAGLILLMSLLGGDAISDQVGGVGFASILTGGIGATIVGLLFWLAGVLVSAQGQILLATLDTAVNQSPFLTNEERLIAIALPNSLRPEGTRPATILAGSATLSSPKTDQQQTEVQAGERTKNCPKCGMVNQATGFYCESCQHNLSM